MNPFVVTGEQDVGYRATNTLAGTRLQTSLADVGSSITVVTEQFMRDLGTVNSEGLLVFTPGTEIGGPTGNFSAITIPGGGDENELPALVRENTNTRVRGLASADNTRNFFLTDIPWDSYNTFRIDLQRGPNSILFGLGNPSGIVNNTTNDASFRNGGNVEVKLGSYGSYRGSLDYNHVLLPGELSFRLDGLFDRREFEERPAFNKDKRIFAAFRYEPKFLSKDGAHTSLRANFEAGDITENRPRTLPPIDRITPWWNTGTYTIPANPIAGTPATTYPALNRSVYDLYSAWTYLPNVPGSGANVQYITDASGKKILNPSFQPGLSEIYNSGVFMFFPDPNSPAQQTSPYPTYTEETSRVMNFGIGPNGKIDKNVQGVPFARYLALTEPYKLAQRENLPFYGAYTTPSLTDPSIFDFYRQLLDGPNKPAARAFHAINLELSQTFANNRAGIDLAVDQQKYHDRQDGTYDARNQMITIDINATNIDGTPNPNVGRPMLAGKNEGTGSGLRTDREDFRATAFAELRAEDFLPHGWLTKMLGRHVFTGLYSTDRQDSERRTWNRFLLDPGWAVATGQSLTFGSRPVMTVQYIGPDLRNTPSPVGLHLQAPTAMLNPTSTKAVYFDSHWKPPVNPTTTGYVDPSAPWLDPFTGTMRTQSENPANYVGWTTYNAQVLNSLVDGPSQLTNSAQLNRYQLASKAAIWQGYLWDDTVVPIFGYRRDTNRVYTVNAPSTSTGVADVNNPSYVLTSPRATLTTEIRSWSLVLHLPPFLRGKLPLGSDLSLTYNRSSNFNPGDVGRVDMLGNPLPPSKGNTEDFGFLLKALHDRFYLRVNWYRASISGSSYGWSGAYWVGSMESRAWVMAKRFQAGLTGDPQYAGSTYNFGDNVGGVFVQTPQDRTAQQAAVNAALAAFPGDLFKAWQIPTTDAKWQGNNFDANPPYGQAPSGYTATRDTFSKGTEIELNVNPTKNWTILINATKEKAVTTNDVGDLAAWIEARNQIWQGPAGDLRLFGGTSTSDTIRLNWDQNVWFPYSFEKYRNGTNQPELAKWHFNFVTRYSFDHGPAKGFTVGGAYRWIDKAAIGYPWTYLVQTTGAETEVPDIHHPIYGPSDSTVNLWIAYQRKISDKLIWQIQLNLDNAFGRNKLIPISVEPDGSFATYRIKYEQTWTVTNRLTF